MYILYGHDLNDLISLVSALNDKLWLKDLHYRKSMLDWGIIKEIHLERGDLGDNPQEM